MRVDCEKCKAPYAIDDALVPALGARAQCPACGNLQMVRPGGPPPAAAASAERTCELCGTPLTDAFDAAIGRCSLCDAATRGRPREAQTVRMERPPLDADAMLAARLVPGPGPVSSPGFDIPTAPGIPSPALLAMLPSEETPVPDAAAGLQQLPPPLPVRTPPTPAPSDTPEASLAVPIPAAMKDEGATPLGPEDIRHRPQLGTYDRGVKTASRPRRQVPWLGIVAALVIGAAGGAVVVLKPYVDRLNQPEPPPPVMPAIARALASWGIQPSGTAADHLERGRTLFREDRDEAYLAAEGELKAALALDPYALRTAALYLEAFAAGRGRWAPQAELQEAAGLADALVQAMPKAGPVHRAQAAVLLAQGETELARVSAEAAFRRSSEEQRAAALVAWGLTYLESSPPIALEKFEAALQLDAQLRPALFGRAVALERMGRHAEALAAYEKRLEVDAGHRQSLSALTRLAVWLREEAPARKAIERFAARRPELVEPQLQSGWLALAERDFGTVEAVLRETGARVEKLDPLEQAAYLTLSAAFARANGQPRVAAQQAAKALQAHPRHAPAHFQAFLAALANGEAAEARAQLKAFEKHLDDPARAQAYQGRAEVVAGNLAEAVAAFREATELAPHRLAVRLALAGVLLRKGEENAAWRVLREALDQDPQPAGKVRLPAGPFQEADTELLRLAADALANVQGDGRPLAEIYLAIVNYHLGETDRPARQLDKVLVTDLTSLPALLYRAQIELDRKQPARALKFAQRAVAAEMQSPVAPYLVGRSLEGQKKAEQARATYRKIVDQHPNFLPAKLRLGVLAQAARQPGEARKWLEEVVAAAPESLEARQALYGLAP